MKLRLIVILSSIILCGCKSSNHYIKCMGSVKAHYIIRSSDSLFKDCSREGYIILDSQFCELFKHEKKTGITDLRGNSGLVDFILEDDKGNHNLEFFLLLSNFDGRLFKYNFEIGGAYRNDKLANYLIDKIREDCK